MGIGLVEVLHQRATEGDVEQLGAAAHAEHRQPAFERGLDQGQLPLVAVRFGLTELGMRVLAVQGRVWVGATCHHQAVETADHVDRIGVAGELDRQTTDRGDPLWVLAEVEIDLFAGQCALRQKRDPLHGPATTRQADQWAPAHGRATRDREALDAAHRSNARRRRLRAA